MLYTGPGWNLKKDISIAHSYFYRVMKYLQDSQKTEISLFYVQLLSVF